MKKIILTTMTILAGLTASAQNGQIPNGGFENWSTFIAGEFLDGWENSASNPSPLFGKAERSTDAQHLSSSLRLETVSASTQPPGFGYAVSGTTGDSGPEFLYPYSTNVDSLIVWLKYDIMPNDSAVVLVMRRNSIVPMFPVMFLIHGSQPNWTRHAFYLQPMPGGAPDSLLVGFTSSNPFSGTPVPGSWMMVDNVTLKQGNSVAPNVINHSFENWNTPTYSNPDSWFTLDEVLVAMGVSESVIATADAATGTYAAQMRAAVVNNDTIQSVLSLGPFNFSNGQVAGIPYSANPTALEGVYKFIPDGSDNFGIGIQFYSNGVVIENQGFGSNGAANYTPFSIPLNIPVIPDSLVLAVISGGMPASILRVDDLRFTGGGVGVLPLADVASGFYCWPNPVRDNLNIHVPANKVGHLRIIDLNGKIIHSMAVRDSSNYILQLQDYPSGLYMLEYQVNDQRITRKVVKE